MNRFRYFSTTFILLAFIFAFASFVFPLEWAVAQQTSAPIVPTGPAQPQLFEFVFTTVWYVLMLVFVYYVFVGRPANLKHETQQKFLETVKRNDTVITSGGIFGRVILVKPEAITVEIAPNVRIQVLPSNVSKPPSDSTAVVNVANGS